jgi:Na+/H+-dicarboxylate symporter
MNFLKKLATNPLTVIISIALGVMVGLHQPDFSKNLKFIGDIYVDLLKMVILPFLVSAVIVSVDKLARDPRASQFLGRIVMSLVMGMVLTGFVGVLYMYVAHPGGGLDKSAMHAFGKLVQTDVSGVETSIQLLSPYKEATQDGVAERLIMRMIPDNIFHALSLGDTLKALIFALMFGFAIASSPKDRAINLIDTCEAVFRACQRLTGWLLYVLPIASFALAADQFASTGVEPFKVMLHFILAFAAVTLVLLSLCVFVIYRRSGQKLSDVLRSQEGPFFIAAATRNSAACMPAMMTSLIDRLGFDKSLTELLVPLGTALFRVGPVLYYCMATIFIAQLYGRELSMVDYTVVLVASVVAGLASTGMNGIVTISQTAIVCSMLGLPFEAAFVLFVAVEPVCDTLRTLLLVFAIDALVALISPLERKGGDQAESLKPAEAQAA